jgi:hypothetical protein
MAHPRAGSGAEGQVIDRQARACRRVWPPSDFAPTRATSTRPTSSTAPEDMINLVARSDRAGGTVRNDPGVPVGRAEEGVRERAFPWVTQMSEPPLAAIHRR